MKYTCSMNTNLILSAHADDAIFSICSWMEKMTDKTIVSTMAGVPAFDPVGRIKHETIRRDHGMACAMLEAKVINWGFYDDVYPGLDIELLKGSLKNLTYDSIYVPLGIHHPDHLTLSNLMIPLLDRSKQIYFYEELPYRQLYPHLVEQRVEMLKEHFMGTEMQHIDIRPNGFKRRLVRYYTSEVNSEQLLEVLDNTNERIWKL